MPETEIELASAIANLREQLQNVVEEGRDKALRFEVKGVEIELKCIVRT